MSWEEYNKDPHTIVGAVEKWAAERPDHKALIFYDTEKEITYKEFLNAINMMAFKLFNMGFRKEDICVASLPNSYTHIILGYACAKLGVIWCPLDLRLKPPEIMICLSLIRHKTAMYCHLGKTEHGNFGMIGKAVHLNSPWVKYVVQFSSPDDKYREGIIKGYEIISEAEKEYNQTLKNPESFKEFEEVCTLTDINDPILMIFTTGTTAFPKPAMLTNIGITCQNMCLAKAFNITQDDRMLVNMPIAYVGGTSEQLMTILFKGGTAIVLDIFDAEKSLDAIQKFKVTCLGQIPASYLMEWRLNNYNLYDLSSLKHAIYGGQNVDRGFLEKLSKMAPRIGTGLGLTETSGLCTYTPPKATIEDILIGIGKDFPIYPCSIRSPMNEDGSAGEILSDGEIGDICFTGPQTFLGYYRYEEATRATLSSDAILYTGDMGYKDDKGIHIAGRKKYLIKPKGYQVFPIEIEMFISDIPEVEHVGVLGAKHSVYSEGIIAYIGGKKNTTLTEEHVIEHCKGMAAYKRPSLIIFLKDFPLTRVNRPDYVALNRRLPKDIEDARSKGLWDKK